MRRIRPAYTARSDTLKKRWDRALRWSLVTSVLVHLLLLLLFRTEVFLPEVHDTAAGEKAGDPSAAAGGMEMISWQLEQPPPQPEPIARPPDPIPVPVPDRPQVEPTEETKPQSSTTGQAPAVSPSPGTGQRVGPGTDTGTGRGDAGTGAEGLNRVTAPSPRAMILPPSDRPGRVRGKTINIYVFVTPTGTVVPDSTRLSPSSGDARFDSRLKQQAAEWRFRPATRGGTPIAAWFTYAMTF